MAQSEEHYLGNPLLKKANTAVELSQEQLIEMAKCIDDPIYFAKNYIKIVTLDDGLVNFEPYPFQEEMLTNFHRKRFNVCKLPRQPLWIETPIPTTKGWKSLGNVEIGDYVFDPDGSPVLVVDKTQVFRNTPCYKITFSCGEEIIADEDHLWLINGTTIRTSDAYNQFVKGIQLSIKEAKAPEFYIKSYCSDHIIENIEPVDSVPVVCITVESDEHLFLCGRNFIPTHNSGKSTTTVAFLVHHIVFNEHTSIAILANKASTAKDILARLQTAYENLPKWMQQGVKSWNKTSMELENGSKVIAASTSASSVRGGTYSLLMLDEYAFVPQQVAENFMRSVYPTITSGRDSKVIVVSTPAGLNHYYKLWMDAKDGKNDYHPFEIHWSDVPGRDAEWRDTQIKNIGQKAFDQEFNTDFLGSSETLISGSKLANIVTTDAIKRLNDLDLYSEPKDEHVYVTIVDTARGVGKDYSAFVVMDVTNLPYKVVAKYRSNDIKPEMYSYVVKDVASKFNTSYILCEVNDIGNQIARDLVEDGYSNMLFCSTRARSGQYIGQNFSGKYELGVKMQKNIKKLGALNLKTLIEEDKLEVNDYDIFAELTTFIQKGPSFEAEAGKNDDLVVCLLLFAWLTTNQYFKDITSIDLRQKMITEKKEKQEEEILPFGFVDRDSSVIIDNKTGLLWNSVDQDEMFDVLYSSNFMRGPANEEEADVNELMGLFSYY
jgi:hypothetical protein